VHLVVDVTRDARFPADGVTQIKERLAAFGAASFRVGADVITQALAAQVFGVSGVLDVAPVKVGLAPNPASSANLVTTIRQLARLDTSRITVNLVG
jgi:hypothetical protein